MHGNGTLHNQSGIYEGEFKKGMITGKGMVNFYNGDKYTGEFLNSSITGYGCFLTHEGTQLIGHFNDGVCNRHGKKIYPDGTSYIGEFQSDVEHGKGVLTLTNGKQMRGIWNQGKLDKELVQSVVMYENSAALAQYTHIKETEKKKEVQISKVVDLLELEMAANMLEEDENVTPLPASYIGFGKFRYLVDF